MTEGPLNESEKAGPSNKPGMLIQRLLCLAYRKAGVGINEMTSVGKRTDFDRNQR